MVTVIKLEGTNNGIDGRESERGQNILPSNSSNHYNRQEPYMSLPFPRYKKGNSGVAVRTEILFNGHRPVAGSYWKISKKPARYSDRRGNMRLRIYQIYVEGSQTIPDNWPDADGLVITSEQHKGTIPRYRYTVETV